jgi:poly-beta-1,6-N-acetyl-D-glucosamine biosynthesis protein PgaD
MDKNTLIINKRHEMPRNQRWFWDGITILLWVGFIYLWHPIFEIFYQIMTSGVPEEEFSDWIYENIHSVTFVHGIETLILTPMVLFTLSWLNRHKGPSEHVIYTEEDYARYFNLEISQLKTCFASQLVTVYFDEQGQIISIENRIQ